MKGLSMGLSITGKKPNTAPPYVLQPAAWYDPSDLGSLYQDTNGGTPVTAVGQPVGRISDKSGNDHHAIQATATARPTYQVDTNGNPYLLFDGVDDMLLAAFTIVQPIDRISAVQQVTHSTGKCIFGGVTASAGVLQQVDTSGTGDIRIYDGTSSTVMLGTPVASNIVVTERHQGASSRYAVNNGAYTTCNPGTTPPGGISIGNNGFAPTTAANIRFYGCAVYPVALTDPNIAPLRTWFGAKCGLVL